MDGSAWEAEFKKRAEEKEARQKQQRVQYLTAVAVRRLGRKEHAHRTLTLTPTPSNPNPNPNATATTTATLTRTTTPG